MTDSDTSLSVVGQDMAADSLRQMDDSSEYSDGSFMRQLEQVDEDDREEAIVDLASEELLPIEELMKDNGTDRLIMGNDMVIIVKELD